ncbi:MAG: YebC/PmpR family DNA-binding transcriptional regulator [Bacteroidota bacterium]|nr:YebC/PmpR family DNA-binding transcriptional regulator [Candidatus Kapabacteria bacterium]MCS7303279.1 YebC/PmpR family DNA-binding transcriptional regulator [Candidatus Kapabacteria bacterium]MCX7936694.1 YebC/PmpR family DNA-binding transcriptional regulator [Chlorobiota bacterium]MDW8075424.1 YebC/PmpR family DNA-binding transcriptional regulator [Bacteroidota bacterium]MDW8272207.1 YebC/PmpR family DNA-binding transcriptional regulator [Bacteroidota bacterium]
MGRIFEKRKERMFARYDRMAKTFTRIGREITIAVKLGGPDPAGNPRLRAALQEARANNMPKDRIEAAIQRALGRQAENLQEVLYEGYAPHGVALMIEAATDNPTRTVANLRSYFNKYGGSLAQNGAVEFLFQRRGVFKVPLKSRSREELELALIEAGAEDIEFDEDENLLIAYTTFEDFGRMQRALEDQQIELSLAQLQWIPLSTITLTEEQMDDVARLIQHIEADDDVQHVYHNIA